MAQIQQGSKANYDVLIQGAGIGGLTLAIALQQRGQSRARRAVKRPH